MAASPARTTRRVLAAAFALVLAVLTLAPTIAAAEGVVFTIDDKRLTNPVGIARDPDNGVFWTANATTTQGQVFALNTRGQTVGRLATGVTTKGVSAIAYANQTLYLGELAAEGGRDSVRVLTFAKPPLQIGTWRSKEHVLTYPDGPHEASTLLATESGQVYVVTRGTPGAVYAAPSPLGATGALTKVADAPDDVVSGAVLVSGRVALRTTTSIVVVDGSTFQRVAESPLAPTEEPGLLGVSGSGAYLLLAESKQYAPARTVAIPTKLPVTPTPSPATVSARPAAVPTEAPEVRQNGTLLAIVAAAALAFVAGGIILLRR